MRGITPYKVVSSIQIINQPLVEYPDSRDLSQAIYLSIFRDDDLGKRVQQSVIADLGRPDMLKLMNRIDRGVYPGGWPVASFSMGEGPDTHGRKKSKSKLKHPFRLVFEHQHGERYKDLSPLDGGDYIPPTTPPPDHGDGGGSGGGGGGDTAGGEPIIVEEMAQPLPAIPLRKLEMDYNNPDSDLYQYRREFRLLCKSIGASPDRILRDVMESDSVAEDPGAIDDIYVYNCIRLWEKSSPGIKYLYKFFDTLSGVMGELSPPDKDNGHPPEGDYRGIGGHWLDRDIQGFIYVDKRDGDGAFEEEEMYTYAFFAANEFYTHVVTFSGVEHWEHDLNAVAADERLNYMYYSDESKFKNGQLIEEYYASTATAYSLAGILCKNRGQVDSYRRTGRGHKAQPEVPKDYIQSQYMRVDSPVLYKGKMMNFEGTIVDIDRVVPGKVYNRVQEGGQWILQEIITLPEEDSLDAKQLSIYWIHAEGIKELRIPEIKTGMQVIDGETGYDILVAYDMRQWQTVSVPLFPSLFLEEKDYIASDIFAASLHVTIIAATVEFVSAPWWTILIKVVGIALMAYGGYTLLALESAIEVALFALEAAIMYALSMVILEIAKQNPALAVIAAVVVMAIGSKFHGTSLLAEMSADLPKVLMQFSDYMSKIMVSHSKAEMEDMALELKELADTQKDALNALELLTGPDPAWDSEEMQELLGVGEEEVDRNPLPAAPLPITPESYLGAFDEFTDIGFTLTDPDVYLDQALKLELLI